MCTSSVLTHTRKQCVSLAGSTLPVATAKVPESNGYHKDACIVKVYVLLALDGYYTCCIAWYALSALSCGLDTHR